MCLFVLRNGEWPFQSGDLATVRSSADASRLFTLLAGDLFFSRNWSLCYYHYRYLAKLIVEFNLTHKKLYTVQWRPVCCWTSEHLDVS